MTIKLAIAVALLSAYSNISWAGQDTPATLAGIEIVDNQYVAKAIATGSTLVVDFRDAAAFARGTLPGGVNCPGVRQEPTELSDAEVAAAVEVVSGCAPLKAAPKDRTVIAFCGHAQCWVSPKAALALSRMGFASVKWLRGGVEGWKATGGTVQ